MQESPVSHADTRSIELVRLSDAGATDDSRFLMLMTVWIMTLLQV